MDLQSFLSSLHFLYPVSSTSGTDNDRNSCYGSSSSTTPSGSEDWSQRVLAGGAGSSDRRKEDSNSNNDDADNHEQNGSDHDHHQQNFQYNDDEKNSYRNEERSQSSTQKSDYQNRQWISLKHHFLSIEPVGDLYAADKSIDDNDVDNDGNDNDNESKTNLNKNNNLHRPLLGPAFFVPPPTDNSAEHDKNEHEANNGGNDFDYGMHPIDLLLVTSRNIEMETSLSPSTTVHPKNYPDKTPPQRRKRKKTAEGRYASHSSPYHLSSNSLESVEAVLYAKVDKDFVYQINLKQLQSVQYVRSEHNDDPPSPVGSQNDKTTTNNNKQEKDKDTKRVLPSCLLLHFPGCSFRIFRTTTDESSSPGKPSSQIVHTKSSSSSATEVPHDHSHNNGTTTTTTNNNNKYLNGSQEGTQQIIHGTVEAQMMMYDLLSKILQSVEEDNTNFVLQFPSLDHTMEFESVTNTPTSTHLREKRVKFHLQSLSAAYQDISELESTLQISSLVEPTTTKNNNNNNKDNNNNNSTVEEDESMRKQRVKDLMKSIPLHVASSYGTRQDLQDMLQVYDQRLTDQTHELFHTIDNLWDHSQQGGGSSSSSRRRQRNSKRRRLLSSHHKGSTAAAAGGGGGGDRSNSSSNNQPPHHEPMPSPKSPHPIQSSRQQQEECLQKTEEFCRNRQRIVSQKYELLSIPQR